MANHVVGRGKPTSNWDLDEGEQSFLITKVKGFPRDPKPSEGLTNVEIAFVSIDKVPLKNKYDLTVDGGYAAFYWLVKNGLNIDLEEGEPFDVNQLQDAYVMLDIIHKPRDNGGVFNNIRATVGPGEPFAVDSEGDESGGEWDD